MMREAWAAFRSAMPSLARNEAFVTFEHLVWFITKEAHRSPKSGTRAGHFEVRRWKADVIKLASAHHEPADVHPAEKAPSARTSTQGQL